jgi:tetratricopeptide (TPR) repeat protein
LEKNPDNMQALLLLALCYQASGDIGKGIQLLRQAVADHPDSDLAHYNLANALAEKWYEDADNEISKEAKEEYERVLELNPRHADAYINYAALLAANKQDEEAYHLFQQARQKGIADPDIETKIGFMEMKRRAPSLAKEAFRRAVALNPLAVLAIEGLGQVAYAEGRFHLAADFYARALRISPTADLAKTLGSILLHDLNDVQGAQDAYQRALKLLIPEDPDRETIKDILKSLDKTMDESSDEEQ